MEKNSSLLPHRRQGSAVNRRRELESSESSRENRENGRSLATNQPTVGLRLRSLRRSSPWRSFPAACSPEAAGNLKGGGRVFLFSPHLSPLFSPPSPSVARNHGQVSPSTKGVSTGPKRVSSKSRNRKRFSRIFTEFAASRLRKSSRGTREDTGSKN